ncbi:MAG: SEC-C metal-binding domain-containing protein [Solirubrobacteraceae bacterium]
MALGRNDPCWCGSGKKFKHCHFPQQEVGEERREWTPGDVAALVANPFYAIEIEPALAKPHKPLIDEETWIAANLRAIEESGAEVWLRNLLSVLKGNYP